MTVRTKEEADHSLPYIISAALLDGQVMPPQYYPERIKQKDIQTLLRKVQIRPLDGIQSTIPWRDARPHPGDP